MRTGDDGEMSRDAIIVTLESLSSQLHTFQQNIAGEIKGLRSDLRTDITELRSKMDGVKESTEKKIDDLMREGCAQGRLDRQDMKIIKADLAEMKNAPDLKMNRLAIGVATLSALVSIFLGVMAISKGIVF